MMLVVVPLALVVLSVGLGLFLARLALDLALGILGAPSQPLFIRWHIVAFATMLFWSWYLAPSLFALQ
jgi:hypothetical protein